MKAKELDRKFDTGDDVSKYLDLAKAKRFNHEQRRVNTDFHRNIFYYYRGASLSDDQRERQLENNTTKALINTLEHCDRSVCQKFLTQIMDRYGINPEIWDLPTNTEFRFDLQQKLPTEGLIGKPNRLLLALVPRNNQEAGQGSSKTGSDSRPDAWIYGDGFAVLIESKVAGGLKKSQKERYLRILSPDGVKPREAQMTWAEVFDCFSKIQKNLNGRDHWLVGQFIQFLEWSGMAGFTGFKKEFFDYFRNSGEEDRPEWVRGIMTDFSQRVRPRIQGLGYRNYRVGDLRSPYDQCWVAFWDGKKKLGNQAHQTVSVTANGVKVFVNVELQPATKRLKAKLLENPDGFKKCMLKLAPFTVKLAERKPRPRQPRQFDSNPVTSIRSEDLLDERTSELGFLYFTAILSKLHLPDFTLVRTIPRNEILGERFQKDSGDVLINEIVEIMKSLDDLVRFIND